MTELETASWYRRLLPEKFNSIIWISEGKDPLAIGNITGAIVFHRTLPATIGILFRLWDLGVSWETVGFLNTLSSIIALVGGGAARSGPS